ncbi:MAG: DNA primase catalytic subunit PriS [Candidatus Altiarchaeales archaeon]|nr:DNA primase catalytic subunit PriS [Candidatus Altiarchaeales archaeon]MBD3417094.1 DNA primase catalytic subunit PriS [Candidatus Altiarchaeales archaeon]
MNTDTKVYLKKRFKEYYFRNRVDSPMDVHRREFGVGTLEDKIRFRHKSFTSGRELTQYLKTEAPYYISYSSAYYEFPENQPMQRKNWLGADLVFDLDKPMDLLDHGKLEDVKEEAKCIVGFLEDDFGFTGKEIKVNFSGSKGYHIHVISDDVRSLNGEARREIIDYITGTGLDIEYFITEEETMRGITFKRGQSKGTAGRRIGPRKDSRGWARRIYDVAEELIAMPAEELVNIKGIGATTAEKHAADREMNLRFLREGRWDALFDRLKGPIQNLIYSKAVEIKDADKQVTLDTSRLIRLPDTIHGGSGLLARKVKDIDSFNPLMDAIAFKDGEVTARITSDVGTWTMMENRYGPYNAGEEVKLPEYAANYLMLKDYAEFRG